MIDGLKCPLFVYFYSIRNLNIPAIRNLPGTKVSLMYGRSMLDSVFASNITKIPNETTETQTLNLKRRFIGFHLLEFISGQVFSDLRFLPDLSHIPSSGTANGHRRRGAKSSHDGTNGITNHIDGETAKLLPLLPPHLHPSKGQVPSNWEDFPVDPQIPDVGEWNCQKIEEYFLKQGFPSTHASVFVREVSSKAFQS